MHARVLGVEVLVRSLERGASESWSGFKEKWARTLWSIGLNARRSSLVRASARRYRVGAPIARGASHGTVLVLFTHGSSGQTGCYPSCRPVYDLSYPRGRRICSGTTLRIASSLHRCSTDTSPRSVKCTLRSPRSTAELRVSAHVDLRPS